MSEPRSDDLEYRPVWAREAARKASGRGGPSFKSLILNLISVAVVVSVVSFFLAPAVAFFGIRAAAEAGDVAGLAKLIDYDAVRASLRPQLSGRAEPLTPPPSILQDPVGAIRRQFDQAVAPRAPDAPAADTYLSPAALSALTRGAGRSAPEIGGADQTDRLPVPAYWSVNRARLAVGDGAGGRTIFTFERRGPYEWKLVHVGLPQDGNITPVSR
ncbi:DUF2939 domain-containing protein [soil metagenome]